MSKIPYGFTLLEVMLAIAIFSTLSFLANEVFSQATEQHQRAQKIGDDFQAIQHAVLMLDNDLMQYVPRKNRQTQLPFSREKAGVIFTTQTRDPAMPFGATFVLATVHWYVENGTLFRAVRYSPDSEKDRAPQPLLDRVSHFSAEMAPADDTRLSTTATIIVERENKEVITRRVVLPGWLPEKKAPSQPEGATP